MWVIALACCYRPVSATGDGGAHAGDVAPSPDSRIIGGNGALQFKVGDGANAVAIADLPVLLQLSAGQVMSLGPVAEPATDLAFTDLETGASAPYEVVSWGSGGAQLWLLVANLPPQSTEMFSLATTPHGSMQNMWSAYALVSHFEPGAAQAVDSAVSAHDPGMLSGSVELAGSGVVGGSLAFMPGPAGVQFTSTQDLFEDWPSATVDMWIETEYSPSSTLGSDSGRVLAKDGSFDGIVLDGSGSSASTVSITTGFFSTDQTLPLTSGAWHHVVVSFDADRTTVYIDGSQVTVAVPGSAVMTGETFTIGNAFTNALFARVDELRVGSAGVSEDFLEAEEHAVGSGFVTFSTP